MSLPLEVDVTIMTNEEKVTALVCHRPPSYTNDALRATYPALLQQPSYIFRSFWTLMQWRNGFMAKRYHLTHMECYD